MIQVNLCQKLLFLHLLTHNLLSYCGLVDARISASEKALPVKRAQIAFFFDIHQLFDSKPLMRSRRQMLKNSKASDFSIKNSEQRNNDSVAILKILPPHCAVVVELQKLENLSAILGQKFFYFLSLLSCLKIINGFENSSPECVFSSMTPLLEQSEAEPTECMYRGSPTYTVFTTILM